MTEPHSDFHAKTISRNSGAIEHDFAELLAELSAKIESGEPIDWERVRLANPRYANELDDIRLSLEALREFTPSEPDAEKQTQTLGGGQKELGDFRIVREIGRGGMGIVYEAQQLSIDRKVALKILPLADLIDQRALARFRNEVKAIATLNHPNIVAVYAIGEERGIHYYAMQLVRGQSLAVVIRELRTRLDNRESVTGEVIGSIVSDEHGMTIDTRAPGTAVPQQTSATPIQKPRRHEPKRIPRPVKSRTGTTFPPWCV